MKKRKTERDMRPDLQEEMDDTRSAAAARAALVRKMRKPFVAPTRGGAAWARAKMKEREKQ